MRREYSTVFQPVGTVPPSSSVKGTASTAAEMIKGNKPTVLIYKLCERLAFGWRSSGSACACTRPF